MTTMTWSFSLRIVIELLPVLLVQLFAMMLVLVIMELVGGILVYAYYPAAKEAALKSMALYDNGTPIGKSVKAAWDSIHKTVSL